MIKQIDKVLGVPSAILLGSLLISLSILISGGIITVKNPRLAATAGSPSLTPAAAQPSQQPSVTLDKIKETFSKSQIKFGDVNKKLIAIEVADPSCPYCAIAAGKNSELNKQAGSRFTLVSDGGTYVAPVPEIAKLVKEGKAAFAWIYTNGHGSGEMGTKALYCAHEQGKFWEAHDLLMSSKGYDLLNNTVKNDKTKSADMATFLQPVIDSAFMKSCLDGGKYDSRLGQDTSLAQSIGISGTPGFYLNTSNFAGAYSYSDMQSAVNSALK